MSSKPTSEQHRGMMLAQAVQRPTLRSPIRYPSQARDSPQIIGFPWHARREKPPGCGDCSLAPQLNPREI